MSVGIESVIIGVKNTLRAITPDVTPGLLLREAAGVGSLRTQLRQGATAAREWRVYPRIDAAPEWWNGSLAHMRQTIIIEVRYHITAEQGGEDRARLMAGSDAGRITHAITQNFDWSSAPNLTSIATQQARDLEVLDGDNFLAELELSATFFLGQDSAPPEISP